MALASSGKWVVSPRFDLGFFILPFVLGLAYFGLVTQFPAFAFPLTVIVWILFAQTHFGSTWFMYADKKNRAYYKEHPFIYYVFPALIFLLALFIGKLSLSLLLAIVSVASLYHVSRQSIGILQIYRAKNKEFDPLERRVELLTIFGWALFSAGFGSAQLPGFEQLMTLFGAVIEPVLAILLGLTLGGTLFILLKAVERETNSFPKTAFLAGSFLTYTPYLYATPLMLKTQVFEIATLTGLIAHYMQYMGLVWLINRNKYRAGTEYAEANPFLRKVSARISTIFTLIAGYGTLMALLYWGAPVYIGASATTIGPSIVCGLMLIHFYIDSYIWRFKNPFIKETVGPFIRPLS